jgi:conjugal transfer pilus assembly protein TraK
MKRNLFISSAAAALMLTAPAIAQDGERIRSRSYSETSTSQCNEWSVDFEFEQCERMPLPNDPSQFGQVYTLTDGGLRTLTVDPGASRKADENDDPRQSMSLIDSVTTTLLDDPENAEDREDTGAAIADAAADRSGSSAAPANQDRTNAQDAPQNGAGAAEEAPAPSIVEENFILPPVVASIPGRTEIMPMAMGHMNRIETPFKDPMIRSSAAADAMSVEFDQNFVYVSVTQPVTLFIHDDGFPDPAIVVSLVPQRIAPRQVRVTLPSTAMRDVERHAATIEANNAPAKPKSAPKEPRANSRGVTRAAEPKPATNTVAHLVQQYSRGQLPSGFMNISLEGFESAAFCSQPGVRFSFRQGSGIASNEYILVRGMAEASQPVDLKEQWCARQPQTLAVAFAPRTQISADHPTDFYVLIRRPNAAIQSARN